MAPTIVAGYGDSAWEIFDGDDSSRFIDLDGSGVTHGDLIVVFATTDSNPFGAGNDYGSLSVSQDALGSEESGISNGPGNAPGTLALSTSNGYPFQPFPVPSERYGHIGSFVYNNAASSIVRAGFTSPPTGINGEPFFLQIVIIRNANTGGVLPISAPQDPTDFSDLTDIPYEAGGTFGQVDGLWINFLVWIGVRDPTDPMSGDSADWLTAYTITDQGTLGYQEDLSSSDYAQIDATFGASIDVEQFYLQMVDANISEFSPAGNWIVSPDNSDGINTDARRFFGGSLSVQVWDDPEWNPFPDPEPEPEPPNSSTQTLHIPYKDYANSEEGVAVLTPYGQHKYLANLKAIESWADSLRCSGSEIIGGDGGETEITYTPTDGKWKEHKLHIPHKDRFSSRHVRENYLAIERWANKICPTLHIPHKDWVLMGGPAQEQVNLLTIERWAREISRCCEGVETDPGGG